ncbi:MAG: glycosyl transferase [Brevibacillus sp.]|uniref:Glycosyl transferase n=2 Tax=Brevibacillus TaxID=55080 RepID=A0AA48MCM1_9BACL|nr:glycosyl transferase [Brevibacillus aydinogluensis]NNV03631.1 glycosyl transferase [Brevibacillus sp. MCWH]REK61146.1 MAG: glycosyl transferase [Brevibacillus sp.]CAJ1003852.1 Glycosyl transferase [Brevibacillus aydinogluensis]
MRPFPVSFRHLERMTDDTGLLEHCLGNIPRRREGYTTDDNARALWACAVWRQHANRTGDRDLLATLDRLIDRYLGFLLWVQQEDGSFHNNIGYDRRPEPEKPSDDCLGRALWACAVASASLPDSGRRFVASQLLAKGLPRATAMKFPRGWAFALAACSFLARNGSGSADSAACMELIELFEERLIRLYREASGDGWHWFEPVMTYGNGVLPWALFSAYRVTKREETLEIAKESLHFLIAKMTGQNGVIRPIGNRGWCTPQSRSDWDQQPLEVMKLALASAEAHAVLADPMYWQTVEKCRAWFYGGNDGAVPMADAAEGSCCDGLTPNGANLNRGAESTLSYLLTEAIYHNAVTGG